MAARLTFAQCWTLYFRLINTVNVQFHTLADGTALTTAGNNFISQASLYSQDMQSPTIQEVIAQYKDMRSDSVNFLLRAREIARLLILEMARSSEVNSPAGGNFTRAFRDVWLYMHSAPKRVRRRIATFGSPAAVGSPTGTGVWYRNTVDEKGYNVESATADVQTIECLFDRTNGASTGLEVFEMRGRTAGQDILEPLGLGQTRRITASSENNSLLDDPSFEGTIQTSGTTLVGRWQTDDASDFSAHATAFRGSQSIRINAVSSYVRQPISNIVRSTPYLGLIRYKDVATRTGTLRLTVGGKTANATLGQNGNWNDLYIALNADSWPNNFITSGINYFQFHCTALGGTGDLLVDTAIFKQMDMFNGVFNAVTAGATDWNSAGNPGDKWTVTDSFSNIGVAQFWTKMFFGLYWPHAQTGSYQLSDPVLV